MLSVKKFVAAAVLTLTVAFGLTTAASAGYYYGSQYYGGWNYCSSNYYYCSYYYKPYYSCPTYSYNYCCYYPSQPSYCYYYNPYTCSYWGRYDMKAKGYSMLAEADRKADLKDIPESAFPKPGPMPVVPHTKNNLVLAEPPAFEMPAERTAKEQSDLPASK